ncbi:MAG: hypothetical protein FDX21_07130 [Chlorobium sp.]|nr:MAG: hypothetical protein FDX21_07130 [Chlorobium sp.]
MELVGAHHFDQFDGQDIGSKSIERIYNSDHLRKLIGNNVSSFFVLLGIARILKLKSKIPGLSNALKESMKSQLGFKSQLVALPITILADLRWLAEQSGMTELESLVAELTT